MKEYLDRQDKPLRVECEPVPVELPIVVAGSMPWSGGQSL